MSTKIKMASKKKASLANAVKGANRVSRLAASAEILQALEKLPDSTKVGDLEAALFTGLSRTSLWRIEHGLDRSGRQVSDPDPLLKSVKMGPKRKVRVLGNLRSYVRRRCEAAGLQLA